MRRVKRTSNKRGRSSKYKPLITKKASKVKKLVKLPNFNPSLRIIWKVQRDGTLLYKKDGITTLDDYDNSLLDLEDIMTSLIQELDYSYEDVVEFIHFLPSLLMLCKNKNIRIINVPRMPNLQEYKNLKDSDD